jgi:hypothetical protein
MYQEFRAKTQLLTRLSVNDPTRQKVVTRAPWPVLLRLVVDADCEYYDSAPTTLSMEPSSLHVPLDEPTTSISTLRQFPTDATAMFIDLTEPRPLIRIELNGIFSDDGQLISGLVDCAATLDSPSCQRTSEDAFLYQL